MNKMISLIILTTFIFTISCSVMKPDARIMGKGKGKFIAIAVKDEKQDALNEAIDGANYMCEKRGKIARLIKKKAKYQGALNEKTNSALKLGSGIANSLGEFGAEDASDAATANSNYKATVLFKCQ